MFAHLLKYSYVWLIIAITYFNCHPFADVNTDLDNFFLYLIIPRTCGIYHYISELPLVLGRFSYIKQKYLNIKMFIFCDKAEI